MTDTTLAPVFRHAVASAGAVDRLVVRWDRETGWAHLAVPGAKRDRFTGFHQFADGHPAVVVAELIAGGFVATTAPRLDDDLMEVHAVPTCQGVRSHAVR